MDCNNCVFKVTDDGVQVGCKAERLQTFIDNKAAEKKDNYYELTQFCNLYRNNECVLEEERAKIMPLFGIVIYHKDQTMQDLEKTVESIMDLDYPSEKIKVVISVDKVPKSHIDPYLNITNTLKKRFRAVELVINFSEDQAIKDTECFKRLAQASYFVKINSGLTFDRQVFRSIDERINKDMKKIIMFESSSATIILKGAMNSQYVHFYNYDLATEHLRELSIKQGCYEKV